MIRVHAQSCLLPLVLVTASLAACDDVGGLRIEDGDFVEDLPGSDGSTDTSTDGSDDTGTDDTGSDSDGDTGGDDTGTDDTGDSGNTDSGDSGSDELEPYSCGPFNPPAPQQQGQASFRIRGRATVVPTGVNTWEWNGCEVASFFDASGELECEIVFEAFGDGAGTFAGFVYEMDLEVDTTESSCTNATDLVRYYRISGITSFELERSVSGRGNWISFGSLNTQQGQGGSLTFPYQSPLFAQ